jgi:threonyl-tRNA synthetase
MLVVGDKEAAERTVSVRARTGGDQGASSVNDFVARAHEEIRTRGSAIVVPKGR